MADPLVKMSTRLSDYRVVGALNNYIIPLKCINCVFIPLSTFNHAIHNLSSTHLLLCWPQHVFMQGDRALLHSCKQLCSLGFSSGYNYIDNNKCILQDNVVLPHMRILVHTHMEHSICVWDIPYAYRTMLCPKCLWVSHMSTCKIM